MPVVVVVVVAFALDEPLWVSALCGRHENYSPVGICGKRGYDRGPVSDINPAARCGFSFNNHTATCRHNLFSSRLSPPSGKLTMVRTPSPFSHVTQSLSHVAILQKDMSEVPVLSDVTRLWRFPLANLA